MSRLNDGGGIGAPYEGGLVRKVFGYAMGILLAIASVAEFLLGLLTVVAAPTDVQKLIGIGVCATALVTLVATVAVERSLRRSDAL